MKIASVILRYALLFLVAAGISSWAWRSFGPVPAHADEASSSTAGPDSAPAHEVLVTYFTTDARCPTCLQIERQTRQAIASGFPDELAAGTVRFVTKNFDRPAHQHFVDTYELAFKTVVISHRRHVQEEAWAKFDDVWNLVDKPGDFAEYLQDGVRKYLPPDPDA